MTWTRRRAHQPGAVDQVLIDLAHAGISVEKHQEQHQHGGERDLGFDAEAEPQHEQRRQRDLGQRIERVEIRVEQPARERRDAEPDAEHDADDRADDEAHDRRVNRRPDVQEQRAVDDPADRAARPTSSGLEIKKLSTSRPDAPCQSSSTTMPSTTWQNTMNPLPSARGPLPGLPVRARRRRSCVRRGHTRSSWYSTRRRSHSAS